MVGGQGVAYRTKGDNPLNDPDIELVAPERVLGTLQLTISLPRLWEEKAMTGRKLSDPARAQRIVDMRHISSMECYRYPDGTVRRVLEGVSLLVARAETWGITCDEPFEMALLMEIIGNVKPYEDGSCSLSQQAMMRLKRRMLEHMYFINDQKLMYPHMHVLSWLVFASQHAGSTAAARQVEWLELLLALDLHHITLTYARFLTAAEQATVAALLALKMPRIQLVLMDLSHIDVPEALTPRFPASSSGSARRARRWCWRPPGGI